MRVENPKLVVEPGAGRTGKLAMVAYQFQHYVWGDTTGTSPIFLEGCSFLVTHNLQSALRRLRHTNEERVM
jgi:hypothetical protein